MSSVSHDQPVNLYQQKYNEAMIKLANETDPEKMVTFEQRENAINTIYKLGHKAFQNATDSKNPDKVDMLKPNISTLQKKLSEAFEKEVDAGHNPITAFFAKHFGWGLSSKEKDVRHLIKGCKKMERQLEKMDAKQTPIVDQLKSFISRPR